MNESTRDEIITNMAENLPLLRMKSGFTQEKLAEMIGISRQTLVAIENKKRQMPWNTFLACLLVFNQNNDTKSLWNCMASIQKNLVIIWEQKMEIK